jgi:hypothetical protein
LIFQMQLVYRYTSSYLEGMDTPVRVTELKPVAINDGFFAQRVHALGGGAVDAIDGATSEAMAGALRRAGMLDEVGLYNLNSAYP